MEAITINQQFDGSIELDLVKSWVNKEQTVLKITIIDINKKVVKLNLDRYNTKRLITAITELFLAM